MVEPQLNMDGQKYKLDDVKFYDDGLGLKGNVMKATFGKPLFALRTIKGKLNLFETSQKTFDIGGFTYPNNTNPYFYKTELKKGYYNKGTGYLKKINYKNLSVDLCDNYESSQELSEIFRLKKQQTLFTTIGSVGCLIGFITYNYSDQYNINSIYTPITSFIIGTASYLLALRKEKLKLKHLKASIEIYNK
tara:strand:- start:111 stop:683 length:573 start_codon:yes stop_codon:yes gene_type:complete